MIKNDIELEFLLKEEDLENKNLYEMTKEKIKKILLLIENCKEYIKKYESQKKILIQEFQKDLKNLNEIDQEIFQNMLQEILLNKYS